MYMHNACENCCSNCLYFCCCGWILSFLLMPFYLLINFFIVIGYGMYSLIIAVPQLIINSYITLFITPRYNFMMKIIGFIFIPIVIMLSILIYLICMIVVYLGISLGSPFYETHNCCTSKCEIFCTENCCYTASVAYNVIKEFYPTYCTNVIRYLKEIQRPYPYANYINDQNRSIVVMNRSQLEVRTQIQNSPQLAVVVPLEELYGPNTNYPPPSAPPAELIKLEILKIWSGFFIMCGIVGTEYLKKRFFTKDNIDSMDPAFILGCPALVILKALLRSLDIKIDDGMVISGTNTPIGGIILLDGTKITNINRPSDMFSKAIYEYIIELKQIMITTQLTDGEIYFLEKWLASGGDDAICPTPPTINSNRRIEIMKIASKINNIAIKTTMMPTFQSNFEKVKTSILNGTYDISNV